MKMVKEESYEFEGTNCEQNMIKDKKRDKKQKKSKKVKKIVKVQSNNSDFSEEDEIPLAAQLECSTGIYLLIFKWVPFNKFSFLSF